MTRTIGTVRVAWCLGRHRWSRPDEARAAAQPHSGAGWWECPCCRRYHIGPAPSLLALQDLAWAARALAGNTPGERLDKGE